MPSIKWEVLPTNESTVRRLEYGLGVSRLTARVLAARGIVDEGAARRFLDPRIDQLGDPFTLPDAERAVERLVGAVTNDDHIMVLGHDDVDGITAATIVFGALREVGADVSYYIPDSPTEGIGVSRKLVDRFKKIGVSLIVTVDCGVSNVEGVAYAKSLGIDTVITDHHEPPAELPDAVGVVDAKRSDSVYPFRDLAGCGAAFRVMEAFCEGYRRIGGPPSMDGMLGMAALGSFADRVPLLGENRIIVSRGMKEVIAKRFLPFSTLRSHVWVDEASTGTELLAKMVPVIGASRSHEGGNLGCELLLSTEAEDADEIMGSLVMEAEHRREKARRALDRAMDQLAGIDMDKPKAVVAAVGHLPDKTVGFCASRLAERLGKPVILISEKGGVGNGEARAPKGVDLVDALRAHAAYFKDFGGHKQAAGFSMDASKISELIEHLAAYLEDHVDPAVIQKRIRIDGLVDKEDLTPDCLKSLLCLEPFGEENGKPVFLLESLPVGVLKEIDGTLKMGEIVLVGETLAAGEDLRSAETLSLVVSPFVDGSARSVEVIDWKPSRQAERGRQ
jgi:single-stranded-DNA-specific exonuclease